MESKKFYTKLVFDTKSQNAAMTIRIKKFKWTTVATFQLGLIKVLNFFVFI